MLSRHCGFSCFRSLCTLCFALVPVQLQSSSSSCSVEVVPMPLLTMHSFTTIRIEHLLPIKLLGLFGWPGPVFFILFFLAKTASCSSFSLSFLILMSHWMVEAAGHFCPARVAAGRRSSTTLQGLRLRSAGSSSSELTSQLSGESYCSYHPPPPCTF